MDECVEGFLDLVLVFLVLFYELLVVELEFVSSDLGYCVLLNELDAFSVDLVFEKAFFSKGDVGVLFLLDLLDKIMCIYLEKFTSQASADYCDC